MEAEYKRQPECECCADFCPGGCAASDWQSTGSCYVQECKCYGTEVDGGLCEGCYLWTK